MEVKEGSTTSKPVNAVSGMYRIQKANCYCQFKMSNSVKLWSFFTLKLPEEAKKIEIFPKFQRWMRKTKCHIINGGYIYRFPRSVLPRPRANIPQYGPRSSVSKRLIKFRLRLLVLTSNFALCVIKITQSAKLLNF